MLKNTLLKIKVKYLDWLVMVIWEFPIFWYGIAIIIIHADYSYKGLLFLILSCFIQLIVRPFLNFAHDGTELLDLLSFMKEYPNCDFYEVEARKYIDEKKLRESGRESIDAIPINVLKTWIFKQQSYYMGLSKVFVIKSDNSTYAPAGLKSFPTLYHGNYIFLRAFPNELNSFDKFRTYHEFFHSSFTSLMPTQRAVLRGMVPFKLLLMYMLFFSSLSHVVLAVYVSIISVIFIDERHYWSGQVREALLLNEIYSDYFAIKALDTEEKKEIFNSKYCYNLPLPDPKLGDIFNSHRLFQFQKMVNGFKYSKGYDLDKIFFYPEIPISVYGVIILVSIHALNSHEYSWNTLLWIFIVLVILIFWMGLIGAGIQYYKNEIMSRTKKWEAS